MNPTRLIFFAETVDYRIVYTSRTGWTPAHDTGANTDRTGKIAYRAGEKTLLSTYAGNVVSPTRIEADAQSIWSNYATTPRPAAYSVKSRRVSPTLCASPPRASRPGAFSCPLDAARATRVGRHA